jgi:predicted site-specific integrase-resolvase
MTTDTRKAGTGLIGAKEAAKRLRIHRKTLYRYTITGKVTPAARLPSGVYRYREDEIEALRKVWANEPASATG